MRNVLATAALALAVVVSPGAAADDAWFTAAGGTGQGLNRLQLGVHWKPGCCDWFGAIRAEPRWQVDVGYLNSRGSQSVNDVAWDASLLGILHWKLAAESRWDPFVELGLGGIVQTRRSVGDRDMGGALNFHERLSTGFVLDEAKRFQLAAFAEHRSNADIKKPNQGLTTYGLELRVALP